MEPRRSTRARTQATASSTTVNQVQEQRRTELEQASQELINQVDTSKAKLLERWANVVRLFQVNAKKSFNLRCVTFAVWAYSKFPHRVITAVVNAIFDSPIPTTRYRMHAKARRLGLGSKLTHLLLFFGTAATSRAFLDQLAKTLDKISAVTADNNDDDDNPNPNFDPNSIFWSEVYPNLLTHHIEYRGLPNDTVPIFTCGPSRHRSSPSNTGHQLTGKEMQRATAETFPEAEGREETDQEGVENEEEMDQEAAEVQGEEPHIEPEEEEAADEQGGMQELGHEGEEQDQQGDMASPDLDSDDDDNGDTAEPPSPSMSHQSTPHPANSQLGSPELGRRQTRHPHTRARQSSLHPSLGYVSKEYQSHLEQGPETPIHKSASASPRHPPSEDGAFLLSHSPQNSPPTDHQPVTSKKAQTIDQQRDYELESPLQTQQDRPNKRQKLAAVPGDKGKSIAGSSGQVYQPGATATSSTAQQRQVVPHSSASMSIPDSNTKDLWSEFLGFAEWDRLWGQAAGGGGGDGDQEAWLNDTIMRSLAEIMIVPLMHKGFHVVVHHDLYQEQTSEDLKAQYELQYLDAKHIFVIVNSENMHWLLGHADIEARCLLVYNSLDDDKTSTDKAKAVLTKLADHLPQNQADGARWSPCQVESVIQQQDRTNCGVYVLVTLAHLATGNPLPTSLDANLWRIIFTALLFPNQGAAWLDQPPNTTSLTYSPRLLEVC